MNMIDCPAGVVPLRPVTDAEELFDLENFPDDDFVSRQLKKVCGCVIVTLRTPMCR